MAEYPAPEFGSPEMTDNSVSGISLPSPKACYRSIWISDFHLGTTRCRSKELLRFLRNHRAEILFLVGDIIDSWNVGPAWHWDETQTAVVEEIWAWRRRGTRIIFLPGNHDETNGDLIRTLFGSVEYAPHFIHRTGEGRRMLVIHGHQFDGTVHPARWMSLIGGAAYSAALKANVWYNRAAGHGYLRRKLKRTIHRLIDFADSRIAEAARLVRADGVICGHTHRPDRRAIGPYLYINEGDWVQSRTALVEDCSGNLTLVHWDAANGPGEQTRGAEP